MKFPSTEILNSSILGITCKKCHALPGFRCITAQGIVLPGFHGIRLREAKANRDAEDSGMLSYMI